MTRGEDLKNPLNIEETVGTTWLGQIKPTRDTQHFLAEFSDMEHGIRAGAITLIRYANDEGRKTVRLIISSWAPPGRRNELNPTEAYIKFIATYCGVGDNDILNLNDDAFLSILIDGIIHFEQGADIASREEVMAGIAMARQHFLEQRRVGTAQSPRPTTPAA